MVERNNALFAIVARMWPMRSTKCITRPKSLASSRKPKQVMTRSSAPWSPCGDPPWRYTIQAEAFAPDDLAAVLRQALIEVTGMDILARTQARADPERADIAEQMRALGLA